MRSLDPAVATKLAKIAARLGSDFDGERANAAAKATMLLRAHGLSWTDVFAPAPAIRLVPEPTMPPPAARARTALAHAALLNAWQRDFLENISRCRRPLTDKQQAVLDGILRHLRQRGAGDAA